MERASSRLKTIVLRISGKLQCRDALVRVSDVKCVEAKNVIFKSWYQRREKGRLENGDRDGWQASRESVVASTCEIVKG